MPVNSVGFYSPKKIKTKFYLEKNTAEIGGWGAFL